MICYRDITFCNEWQVCKKGRDCARALTDDVASGAIKIGLPISHFVSPPKCFEDVRADAE